MKVILVQQIGDPYEPPQTIAVCSSIEKAKELFPINLYDEGKAESYKANRYKSRNLHTGETTWDSWPKDPYIEEVEIDKIL